LKSVIVLLLATKHLITHYTYDQIKDSVDIISFIHDQ